MLSYFFLGFCHFFYLLLFQGSPDLIPPILTLALNDIMTYDKVKQNLYLKFYMDAG